MCASWEGEPFWARGADMLAYSVNSFRFSNLEFKESGLLKGTEFVRMRIVADDTARILELLDCVRVNERDTRSMHFYANSLRLPASRWEIFGDGKQVTQDQPAKLPPNRHGRSTD
ncbi:hypothetical protein Tco_1223852 [Tanacetum coccineum]